MDSILTQPISNACFVVANAKPVSPTHVIVLVAGSLNMASIYFCTTLNVYRLARTVTGQTPPEIHAMPVTPLASFVQIRLKQPVLNAGISPQLFTINTPKRTPVTQAALTENSSQPQSPTIVRSAPLTASLATGRLKTAPAQPAQPISISSIIAVLQYAQITTIPM